MNPTSAAEPLDLDPYLHDPDRWGVSLAHVSPLMLACLDAVNARTVVEIGAYAGDLTRVLVDWASRSGAQVRAIDPSPQPALVRLAETRPELELVRRTSLDALPELERPDVVVIDGDHNHYTVSEELRLIAERSPGAALPLVLLHDVRWPHARRDDYYSAEAIPAASRHPTADGKGGIVPGDPGLRPDGLPYPRSAAHEGGPGNGVLTAVEDFADGDERLRLAVVPAFFGFGVLWHEDAAWAADVAAIVDPWDRHPVLERLEANRVHHLAQAHGRAVELWAERERRARQEAVLHRLLSSSAFALAERLSRLRHRAGVGTEHAVVSRAEVRAALADDAR